MTEALVSASAAAFIIFLLVLPFDVQSHTAVSLGRLFVVENLNFLGVISLAFSVTIDNGRFLFNGKPLRKNKVSSDKKAKPKVQISLFKNFELLSVDVRGSFGNASDAAETAMVSSAIITIVDLIKNTNFIKSSKINVNFHPVYHKNVFDADLKIRIRVNAILIIFTLLKILFKR